VASEPILVKVSRAPSSKDGEVRKPECRGNSNPSSRVGQSKRLYQVAMIISKGHHLFC
jgi:hypothetical protein